MDRQRPLDPYTLAEVDEPWRNRSAGVKGSAVKHQAFTQSMEEIVHVIEQSGLTPDADDLTQLWQALRRMIGNPVQRQEGGITLYVRPDGDDGNDGQSNDAGHAFATIAGALNYAVTLYSFAGSILTLKLGVAGTYVDPGLISFPAGQLIVEGDAANKAAYVIQGAGPGGGSSGLFAVYSGDVILRGVTVRNTAALNSCVGAIGSGASLRLQSVSLQTNVDGSLSLVYTSAGGSLQIEAGCVMGGSAANMLYASASTLVIAANILVENAPLYSTATATVINNGNILLSNASTFSGSATGQRYFAVLGGVININGGGANYFPGSTAGLTDTGGQYV